MKGKVYVRDEASQRLLPLQKPLQDTQAYKSNISEINKYLKQADIYPSMLDAGNNFGGRTVDWSLMTHPESLLIICIEIDTYRYMNWAQWYPFHFPTRRNPNSTSLTLWNSGIQRWVVNTIYVLINPELELAMACYYICNDHKGGLSHLGALDREHKFTKLLFKQAHTCMKRYLTSLRKDH